MSVKVIWVSIPVLSVIFQALTISAGMDQRDWYKASEKDFFKVEKNKAVDRFIVSPIITKDQLKYEDRLDKLTSKMASMLQSKGNGFTKATLNTKWLTVKNASEQEDLTKFLNKQDQLIRDRMNNKFQRITAPLKVYVPTSTTASTLATNPTTTFVPNPIVSSSIAPPITFRSQETSTRLPKRPVMSQLHSGKLISPSPGTIEKPRYGSSVPKSHSYKQTTAFPSIPNIIYRPSMFYPSQMSAILPPEVVVTSSQTILNKPQTKVMPYKTTVKPLKLTNPSTSSERLSTFKPTHMTWPLANSKSPYKPTHQPVINQIEVPITTTPIPQSASTTSTLIMTTPEITNDENLPYKTTVKTMSTITTTGFLLPHELEEVVVSLNDSNQASPISPETTTTPYLPDSSEISNFYGVVEFVTTRINYYVGQLIVSTFGDTVSRVGEAITESASEENMFVIFGIPAVATILNFTGVGPLAIMILAWVVPLIALFSYPDSFLRTDNTESIERKAFNIISQFLIDTFY